MAKADQLAQELNERRANKSIKRKGELGRRLGVLRRERYLYQQDVSDYLNIQPETLSRIETGSARPSLRLLVKLAAFYGVTLDYLAGHMVEEENSQ